tara:strand:+ start:2091 stop:2456 length:366 start_codon:yes stop_codon:yes gene_type:complete
MECPICNENDVKEFYPSEIKNYRERKKKGLKIWRPYCRSCKAEYQHEYLKRSEVKKRRREYHQRPEVKAKNRECQRKRDERIRKKKRRNEYLRRYNQRPEVKAKRRERYLRKKEEEKNATG